MMSENITGETGVEMSNAQMSEQVKTQVSGWEISSRTIGIISLILSFLFNFFILPFTIAGLIFGIKGKQSGGKSNAGIILNSIALVLEIIMGIVSIGFITVLIGFIVAGLGGNVMTTALEEADYDINNDLAAVQVVPIPGEEEMILVDEMLSEDEMMLEMMVGGAFEGTIDSIENGVAMLSLDPIYMGGELSNLIEVDLNGIDVMALSLEVGDRAMIEYTNHLPGDVSEVTAVMIQPAGELLFDQATMQQMVDDGMIETIPAGTEL